MFVQECCGRHGHAFGTATQYLPIPELMPFRLTRQMIGVCRPHSTSGTLKHAMVYTLGALRVRAFFLFVPCFESARGQ